MPNPNPTPSKPVELDALEFELVDYASARRALDELPSGVDELNRMRSGHWEDRRRAPQPGDRLLTPRAMQWLSQVPQQIRPRALADRYPRVLNRIAETWHDQGLSTQALDDLLVDRRGGRRGFPLQIQAELKQLRAYRNTLGG